MEYNVITDLSQLTTIPQTQIERLLDNMMMICCHDIKEQLEAGNTTVEMDIYIGKLCLSFEESQIKYKFIPAKRFEKMVTGTMTSEITPLIAKCEQLIKERIFTTYKDLL